MSMCGTQLALRPGPGSCPVMASPHPRGTGRMEKASLLRKRRPERGSYQPELEEKKDTTRDHSECDNGKSLRPAGDEGASDAQA